MQRKMQRPESSSTNRRACNPCALGTLVINLLHRNSVHPQVNVQRRETERQTEARLRSYSHHAKQQEEEPWLDLKLHSETSDAARSVWEKLATPPETELPATMTRQEYLAAITPGE